MQVYQTFGAALIIGRGGGSKSVPAPAGAAMYVMWQVAAAGV